jgi:CBS domain-containing protein
MGSQSRIDAVKVSDIMTPAAIYDAPDDTLAEAAAKMWQQQTGSLLILEKDALTGIVTERDVLRTVAEGHEPKAISVRDVMTSNPVTIGPETTLRDAAGIMFEKWFRHLPVVDEGGKVLGIISLRDLLGLVAEGMEEPSHLQVLTGHKLVRDRRLERVEPGDLD